MTRPFVGFSMGVMLCLTVSLAHGQARGKGGEKPGGEKQGGSKSGGAKKGEEKPGSKPGEKEPGKPGEKPAAGKPPGGNWSEGKPPAGNPHKEGEAEAVNKNKQPQASGAQGAAAGAAAANRNSPSATGAQGAAAGAAAEKRNAPQASGAEGAAAGAAAANRNAPKATGAEGAAAGAAAANRSAPAVTGAQGAAAGAAVANRNSPATSSAAGAAGYAAVRSSFNHPDIYNQAWYGSNPGAWSAAGWAAGTAWAPTAWSGVASHCGYGNTSPVSYNYGGNVTCSNGNVLLDGQNIGTAEQFSQQASDLAQAGTEAKTSATEKWLPLGVFALVRDEQEQPHLILQMAVDSQGNLRGNYTDEMTDHTSPIRGGVDPKTQRVAWTVGNNTTTVMEAGLSNLTQGEAPALLHKNGQTERWILVRLSQPQ